MAGKHKFTKAYKRLDVQKADEITPIPGILGFLINGEQVVEVPNRNGYVYVRLRDNLSEVTQAFNDNVSAVYGLPVLLVRDENNRTRYRILQRDLGRYENWGTSSPYLPAHGATHSFNPISVGADLTWVYGNQFMPLLVYPSGTVGAGNALISPSTYYRNNLWHTAGGTGTASFLPYKPTGGNNAKIVLVYLDDYDNPNLLAGSEFSANITGTTQIFSYIPTLPNTSALPLSAVRLVTGTQRIVWDNLYDIRPFIVADGFIPTGTARHIIQVTGSSLPDRAILNFEGGNIWGVDDPSGGRTTIIISGSASGGSGGGSLPDMQVGFGNGSAIVGDDVFLYDDTNETLSIGTSNLTNLHDGTATLALVQEGASRPTINLDYYGSSGYPRIQFSSASGVATALGSVASGRALLEISAYGFITGSSAARWREGFEFFVFTNNPWTITGAASARAEMYIKSITGSSASGDTLIMTATREKIDFDTSINISGTFMTDGFRMGRGAQAGYVLTSDAQGRGTWQSVTGTSGTGGATGCRVNISGSFSLANGAYVTPNWFEVIDDNNYFSSANPSRITIPESGWYSINARLQMELPNPPPTGTSVFSVQVIWNNNDWDEYTNVLIPMSSSSYTVSNNLFIHKKLTAGEFFEFELNQNTGGTATILGGSTYQSEVTIVKL